MNTWKEILAVMGVVLVLLSAASVPDIQIGHGAAVTARDTDVIARWVQHESIAPEPYGSRSSPHSRQASAVHPDSPGELRAELHALPPSR